MSQGDSIIAEMKFNFKTKMLDNTKMTKKELSALK